MVPTAEARITRQMLYSAVPLTAIASARVAMLPPVLTSTRIVKANCQLTAIPEM
jgi:hypothetical protein